MFAAGVPDARIDEARKSTLLQIVAELPDDYFDVDEWPNFEREAENVADCRADLRNAVEFLATARLSREVTPFSLPGAKYGLLLTGGMSNGDTPTDAYDQFEYICRCEKLFKQVEEWAVEDYAA
ncbi:MAG: hypothetical protein ACLQNE_26875 [Thermoguttaceae bacterium]